MKCHKYTLALCAETIALIGWFFHARIRVYVRFSCMINRIAIERELVEKNIQYDKTFVQQ